jgi:hypothetical protein
VGRWTCPQRQITLTWLIITYFLSTIVRNNQHRHNQEAYSPLLIGNKPERRDALSGNSLSNIRKY